ncbi:MAG: hypothetical protein H7Z40_02580 [Phycisphaerae bacterium]|nr:hypothetical protein [Gemmatimonadaceae bacterium]
MRTVRQVPSPASSVLSRWRKIATVTGVSAALSLGGCLELQVDDPNGLNVGNIYTSASNTEAALIGAFRSYHDMFTASCPSLPFEIYGNVLTTTSTTYIPFAEEPRIPIDNFDNLNCVSRPSWNNPYESGTFSREVYQGIVNNKLTYGVVNATFPIGQDTPSRLVLARFINAASQLQLGLTNDSAFVMTLETPLNDFGTKLEPHPVVLADAVRQFREMIAYARTVPDFTFPTLWVNQQAITRDQIIRVAQSMITRAQVYGARNKAERDAVNWAQVLARMDSTVLVDFGVQAEAAITRLRSTYYENSAAQNTVRLSNRFIGPADTSGEYQKWLARSLQDRGVIRITTPDRRIHGATNLLRGTRFEYRTVAMGSASLGSYLTSSYRSFRYLNATSDSGRTAFHRLVSRGEMDMIRAEALYRLGRGTEAAALINTSRVAAGLKPVTASGPPAGADCVPRRDDGTCGDLFDAIQYEKRIEYYPLAGDISWYDARGWGKLQRGTPFHIPLLGREAATRGLKVYTYGGVGGPGSAP